MHLRTVLALAFTLLVAAACVVEPIGYREHGYYQGGPARGVWRD